MKLPIEIKMNRKFYLVWFSLFLSFLIAGLVFGQLGWAVLKVFCAFSAFVFGAIFGDLIGSLTARKMDFLPDRLERKFGFAGAVLFAYLSVCFFPHVVPGI